MQRARSRGRRPFSLATAALVAILVASCARSTSDDPPLAYSELVGRASRGDVEVATQEGTELSANLRGEAAPRAVTVSEQLNVWQELCAAAGTAEPGRCTIRYEFREPSETGSI